MCKDRICDYEVQVENSDRTIIQGATKYTEAIEKALQEAKEKLSTRAYIWPKTDRAKRTILKKFGSVDYLEITIKENRHDYRRYTIQGKTLCENSKS